MLLFYRSRPMLLRNCAFMLLGLLLVLALLASYIIGLGGLAGFLEMNQFLGTYYRVQGATLSSWLKFTTTEFPAVIADRYTLTLLVGTAAGMYVSLERRREHAREDGTRALLRLLSISLLLLVGTILLETRLGFWIVSRILPFAVPLAGYGLLRFGAVMRKAFPWDRYTKALLAIALPAAIFFSPAIRYAWHSAGGIVTAVKGDAGYDAFYNSSASGSFTRTELRTIGRYVIEHRRPGDRMFVNSSASGLVYFFADDVADFKIFHSAFLIAPFAPRSWIDSTRAYLLREQPRFIVIHIGDSMPVVTGVGVSSETALRRISGVDSLIDSRYQRHITTPKFDLYVRREE